MKRTYTTEQLIEAVRQSVSGRGVLERLGLSANGSETWKRVSKQIRLLSLDTSHFGYPITHSTPLERLLDPSWAVLDPSWAVLGPSQKVLVDGQKSYEKLFKEVLIENSPVTHLRSYRKLLIRLDILTDHCVGCSSFRHTSFGINSLIPLQIDHINGNPSDHRPENLRHLCPTCHALQPTEAGRKSKGRKKRARVK